MRIRNDPVELTKLLTKLRKYTLSRFTANLVNFPFAHPIKLRFAKGVNDASLKKKSSS